ncbi:MAG TPA: VIT family protein [Acidimicrobiia bacterium]|nr:VIT family protein [Acidimicrobiia bacterium]HSG14553.1 VIT family protein [Gaiellaceae bacterium]
MLLHRERHRYTRVGWLRAAVLGANDGIVSTASLMIGVAASNGTSTAIAVAGLAGLAAGAMSMAAGEYVSVSSQRDTERADISKEERELARAPELELNELTQIYVQRGLDPGLARQVAVQLHEVDPLGAHLRDELGMTEETTARPWQAAIVSAISFMLGAAVPLLTLLVANDDTRIAFIAVASLVVLALTGGAGGKLGGAKVGWAAGRVLLGGGLAMAATALVGELVGTAV